MSIAENITLVEERIQKACDSAGRKREEIILMGVTKFLPVNVVEEAYQAGIRCFGESRVREGIDKFETFKKLHPEVRLDMIGSLQRNKAKLALQFYDCIQSVDRLELIQELAKYSCSLENPVEILLELHTGEETKSGFQDINGLFEAAEMVLHIKNLKPAGLMTMAPYTQDTDLIRSSFRLLLKAQNELQKRFPCEENWSCLSMGMSNDFEIAIKEGSTMLRLGSIIFKE